MIMKNTTLCYIEKGGAYLMMHRTKKVNDENHDKWIGIGGKFEEGESPDECLVREVKEEVGLTLNSYKFRGLVTFVSEAWETEYMHLFTSDDFNGIPTECDEGIPKWIEKNQVKSLPIWEGDKIFFDLLEKNSDFFSLKLEYDKTDKLISATLNGNKII